MGCIYMWTNKINSKRYIGKTHRNVDKRRREHINGDGNKSLKSDINKYGVNNFNFEILHDGILDFLLNDYEIEAIKKYDCISPNGYNLTSGGGTGRHTQDTLDKLSKVLKGKKRSAETRYRISQSKKGEKHYWFGKKNPKHSEAMRGENNPNYGKPLSNEHKQNISKANKGRKHSKEIRNKMSESRKGKKHSIETKRKISQSHKGKKRSPEHIKIKQQHVSYQNIIKQNGFSCIYLAIYLFMKSVNIFI